MEARPLRIVRLSQERWQIQIQKRFWWKTWWAPLTKRIDGPFHEEVFFATLSNAKEYAEYLRTDFDPLVVEEYPAL
jgi:hypothetical protein